MKKNEPCVYINEVRRRGPGKKQKKSDARPRRARPGKEPESGADNDIDQPPSRDPTTKEVRRRGKGKGRAVDTGAGSAVESDVDYQQVEGASMGGYVSASQQLPLEQSGPPPVGMGFGDSYAAPYRPGPYPPSGSPVGMLGQAEIVLGDVPAGAFGGANVNDPSAARMGLQVGTGTDEGMAGMGTEEAPMSAVTRTSGALSSGPSSSEGEVGRAGRRRAPKRVKMDAMEVDEEGGK